MEAIFENAPQVIPKHIQSALDEHLSLEGAIYKETSKHKKDLKKYISSLTDSIGFPV